MNTAPAQRQIWFKGALMAPEDARVEILSPTAQFGLNVFEGIRGYWNAAQRRLFLFRLEEHLLRLQDSCKLMGIANPYNLEDIIRHIETTVVANRYQCDIALRVTVFVDGEGSWSSSTPVEMFIAPIARARKDVTKLIGQKACISNWVRIDDLSMPPRIKSGANYINGRYAHLDAQRAGFDLPIFLNRQGQVAEGAGACLMMMKDGVLVTPSLTASILDSITRKTLLTLAGDIGISCEVRPIDRTELYLADEVFLCGSAAELSPIIEIDGRLIGKGNVGDETHNLLMRYLEVADGTKADHATWRHPVAQN